MRSRNRNSRRASAAGARVEKFYGALARRTGVSHARRVLRRAAGVDRLDALPVEKWAGFALTLRLELMGINVADRARALITKRLADDTDGAVETHARRLIRDELTVIADDAFAEMVARRRRELSDAADRAIDHAIARYDDRRRAAEALAEDRQEKNAKNLRVKTNGLFVATPGVLIPWDIVRGIDTFVEREQDLHSKLVTIDDPRPPHGVTFTIDGATGVALFDATMDEVRIELAEKKFSIAAEALYDAIAIAKDRKWCPAAE